AGGRGGNVAWPAGPVAVSGGVDELPNGTPTTKTSAPCTGCFRVSVTRKRATTERRDRRVFGRYKTRWMISRFGSATSLIELAEPLGASAFVTTAVGADTTDAEPALFFPVTLTRIVVPMSTVLTV